MQKIKVPILRFPEFSDEWEQKKLGTTSVRVSTRNKSASADVVLTNSAVHGVIPQTDFFNKEIAVQGNLDNYYSVMIDDFIYNPRISTSAPVGPFKRNHYSAGVMSPLYNVFRFKTEENLDFYEHYLSTKHWHRYMNEVANYGARSDRMAISSSDLLNLPLPYPSQKEQEKISEFLSGVDKKIDLLSKKKKWLVKYKKALMQKIFSQEIRFKDENGQDYPEWKEKKLGELGEFRTSSVDKIIKPDEIEVYLVNYMNVYRHEEISIKTKPSLSKTSVKPAQLVSSNLQAGDILFTPSSETPSDIGHSVVVRDNLEDTVFSYHLVRFRPLTGLSQDYSNYFCNDQKVLRQFAEYAQGATRFTISREAFQNITVIIPFSLKEQQKIADLLNSIDEKIEAEERKLEKAKEFKKALLQQMFV